MTRSTLRTLVHLGLPLVLVGCQATQREAREQATQRWNLARAEVKAKLASDQLEQGNVTDAAAALSEARRFAPTEAKFVPLQARIWLAEGQTARAAQLLETTHVEGPLQAEVEYLLGVARQEQQRWSDALVAFRRACDLDNGEAAYIVAAAQAHLQLDQAALALDVLQRFADRFGWPDDCQAIAAECHEQLGDWPAATAAWQRVVGAPNADPELRQRWAVALYRAQRYAEAIPAFEALLNDTTGEPPAPLRLFLAECYLAAGNHAAAREQVQLVLQHDADDVRAERLLAQVLASGGDYAAARRAVCHALAVSGNDIKSLELASALAQRAGDSDAAAQFAARLVELDPQNDVAQFVLKSTRQ